MSASRSQKLMSALVGLVTSTLLVGCTGKGFETPSTITNSSQDASSARVPTTTPTPVASPTPRPSPPIAPSPTATPVATPTATPTPRPTVTPTPTPVATPTPTPTPTPVVINENTLGMAQSPINGLRHYGYPLWNVDVNIIPEMKAHSNIVGFNYRPDNPTELRNLLSYLSSDYKAIIFIDDIFKNLQTNKIYDDATINQNLAAFANIVNPSMSNVLYLAFDEPFWRGHMIDCSARGINFDTCTKTALSNSVQAEQKVFLEAAGVTLRKKFAGVSLYLAESGYTMQSTLTLPRNYDLYGFDCYAGFNTCTAQNTVPQTFAINKKLVSDLNIQYGGYRRLGIVAETSMRYSRVGPQPTTPISAAKTDDEVLVLASQYETLLKDDPMVTMLAAWSWNSLADSYEVWQGARSLPKTRQALINFGARVTGKTPSTAAKAPVIEFMVTNPIPVGQQALWFWSASDAASCRSVTEPTVYPQIPAVGVLLGQIETAPKSITYTIECTGPGGTTQKTIPYQVVN